MLRALVLLLAICAALTGAEAGAEAATVRDRVLRYVNDDIITEGELRMRVRERLMLMQHRGEQLPNSEAAWQALFLGELKELTDELLLLQESERLQVQIDELYIRRQVQHQARLDNRFRALPIQARLRKQRERQARIASVLRFYRQSTPGVTPAELKRIYQEQSERFRRPPRAKVWRVFVRPATPSEKTQAYEQLLACFKRAGVDDDPDVRAVITDARRADFVDQRDEPEAQVVLLREVCQDILTAVDDDAPESSHALAADAETALASWAALKGEDELQARLQALREELLGIEDPEQRREAFAVAAAELSAGGHARDGGALGWVEPGQLGEPYDSQIFALASNELSPIFNAGQGLALLLVGKRQDGRQRSFAEASAELREEIEKQRYQDARERLLRELRKRYMIRDLQPLAAGGLMDELGDLSVSSSATADDR